MIDREYRASQRKRRLKMQRIRAAVIFVVSVVLIVLIMFVTPLFNIRNISLIFFSKINISKLSEVFY